MKLLVLGAAGRSGRALASSLLTMGKVHRVFLADNNAEGLGKITSDFGRMPVSPRFLEAESEASLRERMAEADLILGCLGPFHLHEARIVKAAIETGKDYISLCDDPQATLQAQAMDGDAKAKGVGILCGCGVSPGISNLLACRAASRFDSLASIELDWYLEPGGQLGGAAIDHIFQSMSGKTPYYHHREVDARSGSWEEAKEFPPPIALQSVAFLGHPEPLTLAQRLTAPEIRFKGCVGGRQMSLLLQSLGWVKGNGDSEILNLVLQSAARSIIRKMHSSCLTAIAVRAKGLIAGSEEQRILGVVGDYYHTSALLMLAAIEQWDQGKLPPGVHPPEQLLDDPAVFRRLYANGLRILVGEECGRETVAV
jgi:saccharopine dehydrogenase-like NADP-dependent oxidoreductase